MGLTVPGAGRWTRRRFPILAAAAVGFVTGTGGLLLTVLLVDSPWGGLAGAVGCGVTAVYLSEGGLATGLVNAIVADIVSSVAFFLLVLGGYLVYVWAAEGLDGLSAAVFAALFVGYAGLGVAVPVGIVSLGIAVVSGTVTGVLRLPSDG